MSDMETCQKILEIANKHKIGSVAFAQGRNVAVVEPSADINEVVEKIVWAKFLNSGQSLYAPDLVYVHERLYQDFLWKAKLQVETYWNKDQKGFFGVLLDKEKQEESRASIEEDRKNCDLITNLELTAESSTLKPVIVGSLPDNSKFLKKHPRAPILPVQKYKDFNSLMNLLSREKNIQSIYNFSNNILHQEDMLRKSKASNIYFNEIFFPTLNLDLPYSSPVPQTYGRLNGIYGFKTFSMGKTVFEGKKNFLFGYLKPPVSNEKFNYYKIISRMGRIRIFNVYIMGAVISYFGYKKFL
jgi:aldehyde dehydrogenase (NAD+)